MEASLPATDYEDTLDVSETPPAIDAHSGSWRDNVTALANYVWCLKDNGTPHNLIEDPRKFRPCHRQKQAL